MPSRDDGAARSHPTLGDALAIADGRLIAPGGAESAAFDRDATARTYAGVEFFDPDAAPAGYRDRIVLAAGVPSDEMGAVAHALGVAGAVAVVVRPGADDDLTEFAAAPGPTAVLGFAAGDWAHLAGALRSLLGEHSFGRALQVRFGDLFGLADALATLVGGAVSVVDATGQVVGYSTHPEQPIDDLRRRTTLMLQEEAPLSSDPDYQALLRSDHPLHFPVRPAIQEAAVDGPYGRVGIAVRAAGELLGSIWAIQVDPDGADAPLALLRELEPLTAQHLLRSRGNVFDRDRRQSELLRAVVEDPRVARSAASQLMLRPELGCTVVCFRVDTLDEVAALRGLRRLHHLATSIAGSTFPGAQSAILGTQVVTLVPGSVASRIEAFARTVVRTDDALVAGIGSRAHEVPGIARSFREAAATAGILLSAADGRRPDRRLAVFDDVRDRLALRAVADHLADHDAAVGDAASRLIAHDERQGTELARTVLTYLDLQGSVREAALALHVHQNTVRYRLEAVRTELAIDLDAPATRLWLWLRLHTSQPGFTM